jgi:hypothetical protein
MADEDIQKTTMIMKSKLFKWKVMPFGLKNVTRIFFQTMADVFKDWTDQFLKTFVDDDNVHNNDWKDHLNHLKVVFDKLRSVNLKLNSRKCCFGAKEIIFLGHVIDQQGLRLNPTTICAISKFPILLFITNVHSFLGLTGYYRSFIHEYAKITTPLFTLTKKDLAFNWTP